MQLSPSRLKIVKTELIEQFDFEKWLKDLLAGDFYEFEQSLYEQLMNFYDQICELLIRQVSQSKFFEIRQRAKAKELGLKKLSIRKAEIQLRTGKKVTYDSLYSKKVPKGYDCTRHLSHIHWKTDQKSGLAYQSLSCLLSVVCPSFALSKQVLNHLKIQANFDRIRSLSLSMGQCCKKERSRIQLQAGESLCGKRVLISIDGGRTRMRAYKEQKASKREQKYETPWREPKLFVISTIDEKGKANTQTLPIYDSSFGDEQTFELLESYLKHLEIDKAKDVQFVADGALWIWQRAKPMLMRLGVSPDKIIETLDYYHAMEHLEELVLYVEKEQKESIFKKLKQALWKGDLNKIKGLLKKGIPGVNLEEFTPYKYFEKNKNRIDYQFLRANKRPCGSGIVESGIRRIINLRFKCPSSFWYPENVEKLILMRAIALSGRWEIMIQNLLNFRN